MSTKLDENTPVSFSQLSTTIRRSARKDLTYRVYGIMLTEILVGNKIGTYGSNLKKRKYLGVKQMLYNSIRATFWCQTTRTETDEFW